VRATDEQMTRRVRRGHGLPYVAALDGIRAIAVAGVVLYHAGARWLPGGFLGVDLFFVLSGFLITSLLLGAWARYGRIDLLGFYVRRLRRLVPAVVALIIVFTIVVLLSSPSRRELVVAAVVDAGVLTYTFNWSDAFGHQPPWQMDHLWSLSVEEQFYLIWPLLLILLLKVATRRTIMIVTASAAVASALAQAIAYSATHTVDWAYLASPFHAHGILLGCLLGQLYVWRVADRWMGRLARSRILPVTALAVIAVLAATIDLDHSFAYSGGMALAVVAAGVLVAVMVAQDTLEVTSTLGRILRSRIFVAIGRRSYSIYLWNNFIAWALSASLRGTWLWIPVNIVATLTCAEISYRFVERRFLRPSRNPDRYAAPPDTSLTSTGAPADGASAESTAAGNEAGEPDSLPGVLPRV
jgi:peptidoglycan/LPS O-acetylase OafA/YrhL